MKDPLKYPKLRWPINIDIHQIEGQEVLVVNCPSGISKSPLFLVPAIAPILSCFQGDLSTTEIAARFAEHGLKQSIVDELVQLLESNLYLSSPAFFAAERQLVETFLTNPVRPAALAGSAYPLETEALQKLVDQYLGKNGAASSPPNGSLIGLVSPHIDYRRGGDSYGFAYSNLLRQQHDIYIVIGTSHQYSRHMFQVTAKDFDGPLGTLPADKRFIGELSLRYGARTFNDEILHRREHSLELQLPFLSRKNHSATIVPILVGSFHHMLNGEKTPQQHEEYDAFAAALARCVSERRKEGASVCFVCGVDMAHIGKQFGDKEGLSPKRMDLITERDKLYLDILERSDLTALFAHVAEDSDARRICGFSTMYTVLDVLQRANISYKALTYDYRQAVDYDAECAVTFAAMGMYESAPAGV